MKKQYIAALACLMAGAIGFIGVYSSEHFKSDKGELAKQEKVLDTQEPVAETAKVVKPKKSIIQQNSIKDEILKAEVTEKAKEPKEDSDKKEPVKETVAVAEALHFSKNENISWPLKGEVLIPYSMNATVYFATLDQYQYNPAMIISGKVNDKVYFIADGTITKVYKNEETGCTVEQELGDGYTAVYGQLKELTFKKGAKVEGGQIVGYVSEPTKYYSTEGSNVYFSLLKDGKPVDPTEFLNKD